MNKLIFCSVLACAVLPLAVFAATIDTNTAKLQAMDKITGRVSVIEVPVNGEKKFGSLSVVVRSCKTRPVEETPDNFSFIDITDTNLQGEEYNIFKGWMISSSPATNALEHPIYDVWLLQCVDSNVDESLLLNQSQLDLRDSLPMKNVTVAKNDAQAASSSSQLMPDSEIKEMQSAPQEVQAPQNLLQPNEFSFDEDEEVSEIGENDDADDTMSDFTNEETNDL